MNKYRVQDYGRYLGEALKDSTEANSYLVASAEDGDSAWMHALIRVAAANGLFAHAPNDDMRAEYNFEHGKYRPPLIKDPDEPDLFKAAQDEEENPIVKAMLDQCCATDPLVANFLRGYITALQWKIKRLDNES